jgi:hypothetical protein
MIAFSKVFFLIFVSQILEITINQRTRLIEEVDGKRDNPSVDDDEIDEEADNTLSRKGPSAEALAKITDYCEIWSCVLLFSPLIWLLSNSIRH